MGVLLDPDITLSSLSTLRPEPAQSMSTEGLIVTLIVVFLLLLGAALGARWLYNDRP